MKILIPSEIIPSRSHNIRAANIVLYNIIQQFIKNDIQVDFLYVNLLDKKINLKDLSFFKSSHFNIVQEIKINNELNETRFSKIKKIFFPKDEDLFPILKMKYKFHKVVSRIKPDWIFILWSESLTHLFSELDEKVFAYYGNPLTKNIMASNYLLAKYESNFLQKLLQKIYLINVSRIHLRIMRKLKIMGNVAKNDSLYYKKKGLKNSFYIQNTWSSKLKAKQVKNIISNTKLEEPYKIAANVGKLNGTANTFGLIFLFEKLIPELKKVLCKKKFEIHIFGSEKPKDYVLKKNKYSEVFFRGFVKDIDTELLKCPVFLCCNNATLYNVGHTRYLHAWTLGRCIIAHSNVRDAMPEIMHNKNSLLGSDEKEISKYVKRVFSDEKLFSRLSFNGYQTFIEKFDSKLVVKKILKEIQNFRN
tara:strand:- start:169 stop:1422 length:1254 start_codon:yes stop_codon:yes gene_type:complete